MTIHERLRTIGAAAVVGAVAVSSLVGFQAQAVESDFPKIPDIFADVGIEKSCSVTEQVVGGQVTFTVTVTNHDSEQSALNVIATDQLPVGLVYISHVASVGTYNTVTGIWDIGDMAANAVATLSLTAQLNGLGDDAITNNVDVLSTGKVDNVPDNNFASCSVTVTEGDPTPPPPPPPSTTPCINGEAFAASAVASNQGNRKDGSSVLAERSITANALGAPDNDFFSLGQGGSITLAFSGFVMDVPGNDLDLSFHEMTNDRDNYPEETAKVEVSQDNSTWFDIGSVSGKAVGGVDYKDISPSGLSWIKYVRITDTSDFGPMPEDADGFDVDAVDAQEQVCATVELSKEGSYDSLAGEITFTIGWEVIGQGSADSVEITDPVPAGTTFVSADNGGIHAGGIVTWDLGTKAAGSSGSVSFVVSLDGLNMWAASVVSSLQGTQKDGAAIQVSRSNENSVLGAAEGSGSGFDIPPLTNTFFSLGFNLQGETGGTITVGFSNTILNGAGNDIKVFETTFGPPYPDEQVKVEASPDNVTYTDLGVVTQDGEVDLGVLTNAKYVRLTDTSDIALFEETADAFDVDAIKALHAAPDICDIDNTATISWVIGENDFSTQASTTVIVNEAECRGDNGGGGGSQDGPFTLTITTSGDGEGVVEDSDEPNKIFCDSNGEENSCSHVYPAGTVVTLTATPDEGSTFANSWSATLGNPGTCTAATSPCTVTMNGNVTLDAHFDIADQGGGGSSSTSGGGGGGQVPPPPPPGGRVLGDVSPPPPPLGGSGEQAPEVLGDTTQLPRTGMTVNPLLALELFALLGVAALFSLNPSKRLSK